MLGWTFIVTYLLWGIFIFCLVAFNYTMREIYKEKFEMGLENIVKNGEFLKILEKYYGKGKVSKEAITLIQNTIKSFK